MDLEDHGLQNKWCKIMLFWGLFSKCKHITLKFLISTAFKDPLCKVYGGLTLLSHVISCLAVL